jgi:heme O synthase-like polyprenyltransferase
MYRAVILYRSMEIKDARKLLYASLMYLPLLQLIYVIDLWK